MIDFNQQVQLMKELFAVDVFCCKGVYDLETIKIFEEMNIWRKKRKFDAVLPEKFFIKLINIAKENGNPLTDEDKKNRKLPEKLYLHFYENFGLIHLLRQAALIPKFEDSVFKDDVGDYNFQTDTYNFFFEYVAWRMKKDPAVFFEPETDYVIPDAEYMKKYDDWIKS